ncbi:hypothetical protein NC652_005243 [Populus alba x Populus x berolinensis]|nr:hypothetical protein NC652_005243 [Populus alba x Populus x berolinensis]
MFALKGRKGKAQQIDREEREWTLAKAQCRGKIPGSFSPFSFKGYCQLQPAIRWTSDNTSPTCSERLKAREQSNWAANSNKRQMIHQATKNSVYWYKHHVVTHRTMFRTLYCVNVRRKVEIRPNDDRFLSGPVSIEACREG